MLTISCILSWLVSQHCLWLSCVAVAFAFLHVYILLIKRHKIPKLVVMKQENKILKMSLMGLLRNFMTLINSLPPKSVPSALSNSMRMICSLLYLVMWDITSTQNVSNTGWRRRLSVHFVALRSILKHWLHTLSKLMLLYIKTHKLTLKFKDKILSEVTEASKMYKTMLDYKDIVCFVR